MLRLNSLHLIKRFQSTPSLANLEARWTKLPEAEQGAIADQLAEAQKGDWKNLTLEQKRAAYYIAYGPYGARAPEDPALNRKVLGWVAGFCGIAFVMWSFYTSRMLPTLKTTTPEWKAAQDAKSVERKMDPYSGPFAKVANEQ